MADEKQAEQLILALKGPQWIRKLSGSLYSRGGADSYYGRGESPHWRNNGVTVTILTPEERLEYLQGYQDNELSGAKKDWR